MSIKSREVRLASRPKGEPVAENFQLAEAEIGDPQTGEVLVRNQYISVDPYMRGRMNEAKSYVPAFELGKAMTGGAVGRVVQSKEPTLPVGTYVMSMYGWREAFVAPAVALQRVDASLAPPSAFLGTLGVTGMTAWVGLFKIAGLKDGETVFVSGGAGAVGSIACQLAKLHGCRVIASAGAADKIAFLKDVLKVDYAFNYSDGDPVEHLKQGAPGGIDVYFDNTGGPQLEASLSGLRERGRIAMCGAIAGYNTPVPGPRNLPLVIGKRLRIEGFIVSDYMKDLGQFLAEAAPALKAGKLVNRETVVEGLENAPEAFMSLLRSGDGHMGKMVVKVG
ncbi:MAG: NADP-dependent oxidoreductase [Bryobacteraceae bacterium]